MSQSKATRTVTVANPEGLHARAATRIADVVRQFNAKVEVIKDCQRVDGTEVLQLLSLCALQDEQLLLEATGRDAETALDALVRLFAGNFNNDETAKNPSHQVGEAGRSETAADGDLPTE